MRTQKARGIAALAHYSNWPVLGVCMVSGFSDLPATVSSPRFVRPCPMRPRHGFVDSRICHTPEEIRIVWEEARAADPEAELVIMSPIAATCSAVLAGDRLAIGPGNDGATAGHAVQELRVIPLAYDYRLLVEAGINDGDTPFLELVAGHTTVYAVQLRAGPALPTCRDYIPRETVVTSIVTPHDDLCRWEAEVPQMPRGTVVVAPGGSLASHAAIHCVIHGVPFVTSHVPAIGSTLAPVDGAAGAAFKLDSSAFLRGSAAADARLQDNVAGACKLSILVLHQWAALRSAESAVASRLLGFACRALARAGAAICAGEARHYSLKLRCQRRAKISRSGRIQSSLAGTLTAQRRALTTAGTAFKHDGWRAGFGGSAWQECASAVDRLWRAQARDLTEADLVAALNRVVNVAHNNGRLFNKLVDSDYLNSAAAEPTRNLVAMLPTLFAALTVDVPEAPRMPKGGRIKRPEEPKYTRLHVHTEPSGIKAQLWNDGYGYVSHHVSVTDDAMIAWLAAQPPTSRSRYNASGKLYVAVDLDKPINATNEAIVAAVRAMMAGAS